MTRFGIVLALLAGCGSRTPGVVERMPDEPRPSTPLAEEDVFVPSYGKPELASALATERAAEASADKAIAELVARETDGETVRIARADLAVRRRFIASLEMCEASGRRCPPRLDEPTLSIDIEGDQPPKLDSELRFDAESWRTLTAELFGRSCACRTVACIDGMFVAIARLETRPTREVLDDEASTLSITRARECLFRLRGKVDRRLASPVME